MADDTQGNARMLLEVTAVTHRGAVRTHNEDAVVVGSWTCGDSMSTPRQSEHDLAEEPLVLVADGMGGHVGGREASQRAASGMVELASSAVGPTEVAAALREVNRELFATAAGDPTLRGMGTTVPGIVAMPDRTVWFNVGDSRVYSVRQGSLRQLSVDDVPTWAGAPAGRITQALGGTYAFLEIDPHVGTETTRLGRPYLLCSDGLTDALPLETVERASSDDDQRLVCELRKTTLAAGAPDNDSIVLASIRSKSRAKEVVAD